MDLTDKVLYLENKKYLVIEDVDYEGSKYAYLVNDDDENDSMFAEIEDNKIYTIDPDLFAEKILPLFEIKFAKSEE